MNKNQLLRSIARQLGLGVNFLDTADLYGFGANEILVGKAIKGQRERVIIATKFGIQRSEDATNRTINGTPAYVQPVMPHSNA